MGANTSVYTANSTIPIVMRDYPWSGLPNQPTKEQWELDIPIELSIWGVLGIVVAILVKTAAIGLTADTEFKLSMLGNNQENPNGLHKVDLNYYLVNGVAYIVKAILNIATIVFGLSFYCNRI